MLKYIPLHAAGGIKAPASRLWHQGPGMKTPLAEAAAVAAKVAAPAADISNEMACANH